MGKKVLREVKTSLLLLFWLLLTQVLSALFFLIITFLLDIIAHGGINLASSTPLWERAAGAILITLFWYGSGRMAPEEFRPSPLSAAAVLALWAVLTCFAWNIVYILLIPQAFLSELVRQIQEAAGLNLLKGFLHSYSGHFLPPVFLWLGLYLRRKGKIRAIVIPRGT